MSKTRYKIAVPPGVGDVYWCLTKLAAWRREHGAEHVEIAVQQAGPGRSTDWASMCDFVDTSSFLRFKPGPAERTSYSKAVKGADAIMWPNAIVDAGRPLSSWLPHLDLDLDFPVHTEPSGPPRVVIYASSVAINRAWLPSFGTRYWLNLMKRLSIEIGSVTVIGAGWDRPWSRELAKAAGGFHYEDLTDKTRLPEVADILKHARVVVGAISGMTILANHFRTPCIAFYPDAHHPDFPRTWVADDAPYIPVRGSETPPADALARMAAAIARPAAAA